MKPTHLLFLPTPTQHSSERFRMEDPPFRAYPGGGERWHGEKSCQNNFHCIHDAMRGITMMLLRGYCMPCASIRL